MADGAPASRYAPKMAGKAGVPEDFIPITDPEELASVRARMLAYGRAHQVQPFARRLRRLAEKLLATAASLEGSGAEGVDLQALHLRIAAMEAKWDGLPRSPVELIIREVVRGKKTIQVVFGGDRSEGEQWVGPRAISWRYIEDNVPQTVDRSIFEKEGWERFDAFIAGTDEAERADLLLEAIAVRRREELDEALNARSSDEAMEALYRAIETLHFAKGKQGPKSGTHAAFRDLFAAWDVPVTSSALKMALSRGLKKYSNKGL
ncbi:MAG: hypothetical protein HOO96_29480 [Polyangiaceae bacterium]|nr:hypothetical protein [Polyangiaceae bacterium]